MPPVVGLTCSLDEKDARVRRTYIHAVIDAGGTPILLPPPPRATDETMLLRIAAAQLDLCDAIVFTGGPDPRTEHYGVPTHQAAEPLDPDRQRYEEALLAMLDSRRNVPVLGVCLGMQMMALHAGGMLNQHLPDDTPTHADHLHDHAHPVIPEPGAPITAGSVASHHHQAVRNPGRLRTIARAHDGVIEAIDDPARPFYLGVQWHPERTQDPTLGPRIFQALVSATNPRP